MEKNRLLALRTAVLSDFGAEAEISAELLAYNENVFDHEAHRQVPDFPLPSEPFVERWKFYARLAANGGAFAALAEHLPQLAFPIRQGISEEDDFRQATRKGINPDGLALATGLQLNQPEAVTLVIHPTPAGEIPIITVPERVDFLAVHRALINRCEPVPIPDSKGATMVAGYNNWDRVHAHRQAWEAANPEGNFWLTEFPIFRLDKQAYQDKFILLSVGAYSGVPAAELGLEEAEWLRLSSLIRREHESAHYFTRRLFASMRNNVIDEIIADYMGIVAAHGAFRCDWFLHFVGLAEFPVYRVGRRLENYRGSLSDEAFTLLQALVVSAVKNLESFDTNNRDALNREGQRARLLFALTRLTLEELASSDGQAILENHWRHWQAQEED